MRYHQRFAGRRRRHRQGSKADLLDSHQLQQAFQQQLFDQIPTTTTVDDSSDNLIHGRSDTLVDEFESKSCSENPDGTSGDDGLEEDPNQRPNKKKRYHRHTQHQIQEMEAFFKECPHPDDKQRKELSRELGLEPLQVKFWFQNKRTQMKNQHERHENAQLRAENDKLRAENMRYKEALGTASCPSCGGPAALGEMSFDEHHLRLENARLRDEIDRISGIAAKHVGKPMVSFPVLSSPLAAAAAAARSPLDLAGAYGVQSAAAGLGADHVLFGAGAGDLLRSVSAGQLDADKPMIVELAVAAMDELLRMARPDALLWGGGASAGAQQQQLDEEEYVRTFPAGLGPRQYGLRPEASRDSAVVIMTCDSLIEILMDANRFAAVFSSIVSRASTHEVLSTGVAGSYNGALQVMSMEFQVPSPLVPTRESYFVRYCKNNPDGTWAVVDVSLDSLRPSPVIKCRRRPSGCLIQEMPNGYSKVTWVEHVEVDDRSVHNLYRPLVNSGLAFGAKRWVGTLDRQCERLASAMASNIPNGDLGVITSIEGRKSMLKLAERMVASFCGGVTASAAHQWTTLSGSGAEDVRVMTRKSVDDPGRPPGIVLNAATSFWLPVPPKRVFDFLRDETSRSEWDILSNGGAVQEMAHIANGRDHGNCVSLLRVNSANSNQSNMLILQESCTDASGSYVVYAPVDVVAMNVVLNGGDPDYVALLPSGFAILPDGPPPAGAAPSHGEGLDTGGGGSLLTVAFQILVDSVPTAKLSLGSVATVNSLIACTVERIKAAVCAEAGNPQ
ncbi:outer cell layer5a isoform X1 [Zea mays]|uniref:Homeobox-leucine zipper protein MERISTEM L1 n=1 Tax=Zea mays TaxID=4577 RepID=K7TT24_MAIZE|nr:outer cell layer5a isoform X1 [Zea mays]AQK50361.1 Homeobox-leucine zipper protein MERISTEM L1 [Zea mays]|eukprot:XP_020407343.1 outer cell layer5a isoform X1 [Zea mays]